jgi:DNA-binding transcriptional ArsR family regulator
VGEKTVEVASATEAGAWKTLTDAEALNVIRAYGHPVRRIILTLLDVRPMRKSEIARYIHRFLGKKYSRSLIQHHIKLLERAGLVGYMDDPEVPSKTKLAYLAARIRIQLKQEPKPRPVDLITSDLVEMEFWQRYKEQIKNEREPPT